MVCRQSYDSRLAKMADIWDAGIAISRSRAFLAPQLVVMVNDLCPLGVGDGARTVSTHSDADGLDHAHFTDYQSQTDDDGRQRPNTADVIRSDGFFVCAVRFLWWSSDVSNNSSILSKHQTLSHWLTYAEDFD